jgi:hypothetical protein
LSIELICDSSIKKTKKISLLDIKISTSCDKLESILRNLIELEEPLQMAQAVNHKTGPFAELEEHTTAVKSLYDSMPNALLLNVEESSSISDDDASYNSFSGECSKCQQRFPNHVLPFHSEFCSGQAPTTSTRPNISRPIQRTQPLHQTPKHQSPPLPSVLSRNIQMRTPAPVSGMSKPTTSPQHSEGPSNKKVKPEIQPHKTPDSSNNEKTVHPGDVISTITPMNSRPALAGAADNFNENVEGDFIPTFHDTLIQPRYVAEAACSEFSLRLLRYLKGDGTPPSLQCLHHYDSPKIHRCVGTVSGQNFPPLGEAQMLVEAVLKFMCAPEPIYPISVITNAKNLAVDQTTT